MTIYFISSFIIYSIIAIIAFLLEGSFSVIQFNDGINSLFYILRVFTLQLLFSLVMYAFLSIWGILLRKTSYFIMSILVISFLWPTLVDLISTFIEKLINQAVDVDKFVFLNYPQVFVNQLSTHQRLLDGSFICIISFIICSFLGITIFRKKEMT